MGVVFKARHRKLDRIVALKVILGGQFASDEEIERFHTEARAAAHLDHPTIVPIYDVNNEEGCHYFSMGFVEGQDLEASVRESLYEPRAAARLMLRVAGAVHYAHEQGVLHRDLKPANCRNPQCRPEV